MHLLSITAKVGFQEVCKPNWLYQLHLKGQGLGDSVASDRGIFLSGHFIKPPEQGQTPRGRDHSKSSVSIEGIPN